MSGEEVTRADVASLAVQVGSLGGNVESLRVLIAESLARAEQATQRAAASPTRDEVLEQTSATLTQVRNDRLRATKRIYLLLGAVVGLLAVVALLGLGYVHSQHSIQVKQYQSCLDRNAQAAATLVAAARSETFFKNLLAVEQRGANRGDHTAQELLVLLTASQQSTPATAPAPMVTCRRP